MAVCTEEARWLSKHGTTLSSPSPPVFLCLLISPRVSVTLSATQDTLKILHLLYQTPNTHLRVHRPEQSTGPCGCNVRRFAARTLRDFSCFPVEERALGRRSQAWLGGSARSPRKTSRCASAPALTGCFLFFSAGGGVALPRGRPVGQNPECYPGASPVPL